MDQEHLETVSAEAERLHEAYKLFGDDFQEAEKDINRDEQALKELHSRPRDPNDTKAMDRLRNIGSYLEKSLVTSDIAKRASQTNLTENEDEARLHHEKFLPEYISMAHAEMEAHETAKRSSGDQLVSSR